MMTKFCIKCGTSIPDGAGFCLKCGTKVVQEPVEPIYQQPYMPPPPPKSNKKIMIGAIVIVIIIILAGLLVYFYASGNDKAKIVGKWELERVTGYLNGEYSSEDGNGTTIEFKSDGTVVTTKSDGEKSVDEWELDNNKICIISHNTDFSNNTLCWSYELTDNGNKLTMTTEYSPHSEYSLTVSYHLRKI